jgi:hypothetical protein
VDFRHPSDTQRLTVIGKTGSGKTQGAVWQLARRSFDRKPWIVFDFKLDDLINELPHTTHMSVTDALPKKPGLYIVHPKPGEEEYVEEMLWRIWARENIGVYIDELYMINKNSKSFRALLTQGRSKRIPIIGLTQRPVDVSRFCFSEADYIQLYTLNDRRDYKTVKEFMPMPIESPLPAPYYSFWWDNSRNYKAVLKPVPQWNNILDVFHERLGPKRAVI